MVIKHVGCRKLCRWPLVRYSIDRGWLRHNEMIEVTYMVPRESAEVHYQPRGMGKGLINAEEWNIPRIQEA